MLVVPIVVSGASWAIVVVIVVVVAVTSFSTPPTLATLATELAAACTRAVAWRTVWAAKAATFATFAVARWRWAIWAARATEASATFFAVTGPGTISIAEARAFTIARRTGAIAIAHPRSLIGTTLSEHVILRSTAAKSATFPRRSRWTTTVGKGRMWPVFVDELGKRFEFFFAELIVVVLIELREEFFRLGHHRRRTTATTRTTPSLAATRFGAAPLGTATTAFWSAAFGRATPTFPRAAFAAAITITTAAADLAHLVTRFFALVVAEFAVAVFVELFQYFLAHFSAVATIAFFAFLVAGFSAGRHRQHSQ